MLLMFSEQIEELGKASLTLGDLEGGRTLGMVMRKGKEGHPKAGKPHPQMCTLKKCLITKKVINNDSHFLSFLLALLSRMKRNIIGPMVPVCVAYSVR